MIKLLLFPIMFMQIISCQELPKPKMKTEVVVDDMSYIDASTKNRKQAINNIVYVHISKKLTPDIIITKSSNDGIEYSLQGNVESSGLSINHPINIKTQQKIINDTLVISHFVSIIGMAGKEGSSVMGYNYLQDEKLSIPNGIKNVRIELYEEFTNQKLKEDNKIVLLIEKCIELEN